LTAVAGGFVVVSHRGGFVSGWFRIGRLCRPRQDDVCVFNAPRPPQLIEGNGRPGQRLRLSADRLLNALLRWRTPAAARLS